MAEISEGDLGDDYWTTTAKVRDNYDIEIGNERPDFDDRIQQATDRVQAWWSDATGEDVPDDLPAADDIHPLLQDATALMAASLAHQAFSHNISGDNDGDQRHVFLEDSARDTFDDWKTVADLDPGDEATDSASNTVTGVSGVIGGRHRSPIHRRQPGEER